MPICIQLILLCADATRHDVERKPSERYVHSDDGSSLLPTPSGSYGWHRDTAYIPTYLGG